MLKDIVTARKLARWLAAVERKGGDERRIQALSRSKV
jgi:hypothetical protein